MKINLLEAIKAVTNNLSNLTDSAILSFRDAVDKELGQRQEREKSKICSRGKTLKKLSQVYLQGLRKFPNNIKGG